MQIWNSKPHLDPSRISFVGGSFLASPVEIPKGQPTYVIRHVLHDWTDDDVVLILSAARDAMSDHPPNVVPKLLLVEMLLHHDSSRFIRTTSMQLLALNSGITRTVVEMARLVERAGMRVVKTVGMRAADSIMEVVLS